MVKCLNERIFNANLFAANLLEFLCIENNSLPLISTLFFSKSYPVRSYTTRLSTSPTRTTYNIRTRPSILEREYQRIESKVRSRPASLYTESYLNSDSVRVSYPIAAPHFPFALNVILLLILCVCECV